MYTNKNLPNSREKYYNHKRIDLEFALPVCQSCGECHVLGSFFIPVDNWGDCHNSAACSTDTYFSCKRRTTIRSFIYATFWCCSTTHHIVSVCIYPESWSARRSREVPGTVGVGEDIRGSGKGVGSCICGASYTWSFIVFDFPAVYRVTRESEPVGISQIGHSFDAFSGERDRFDPIFWVTSKIYPPNHSREHRGYSESENCCHGHDLDERYSSSIEMIHQRGLHFLILWLSWRVVYRGDHPCFHRTL